MVSIYKVSVREIIEFVLRKGSLDNRFSKSTRAVEGTIAHQKLQKENSNLYENYDKEVKVLYKYFMDDSNALEIEGRIDGVILEEERTIIEEIKSTAKELVLIDEDYNELHWMQAVFYGFMYCEKNQLNEIYLRVSYYNIENSQVKSFERKYTISELKTQIDGIVLEYIKWIKLKTELVEVRNKSIQELKFPFDKYRKGQDKIVRMTYSTIKEGKKIFIQAPTGVGKTISTLFPALKAIGEGYGNNIIYVTAKTVTRTVAEEAINILSNKGFIGKSITLTAKEKICLNDRISCNPQECIYAKNYFDKLNNIVGEVLKNEKFITRDILIKYGKKYEICPFELSLELAGWCDCIICDYNYIFDPNVNIKRFYDKKDSVLLVDEAHNLVERSREMYSASLAKKDIMVVMKILKGKARNIYKSLDAINKHFIERRRELESQSISEVYCNKSEEELNRLIKNFMFLSEEYLVKSINTEGYEELLKLYFDLRRFSSIIEVYGDEHVTYEIRNRSDFNLKLYCIDPSRFIKSICGDMKSTIIFSATLEPMNYYIDLLGGDSESYRVKIDSPFNESNLKKYISNLDMKFSKRKENLNRLIIELDKFINRVKGNTIIFFPSYQYMKEVYEGYIKVNTKLEIQIQNDVMDEEEREEFIKNFKNRRGLIGFCVLGGMFSEGVDLPGEALEAVVVIGVGFPMMTIERKIIMNYYKSNGFEYAYVYPGINRVLQGIGRVIRREEDEGYILLIDNRYDERRYRELLPSTWKFQSWK